MDCLDRLFLDGRFGRKGFEFDHLPAGTYFAEKVTDIPGAGYTLSV